MPPKRGSLLMSYQLSFQLLREKCLMDMETCLFLRHLELISHFITIIGHLGMHLCPGHFTDRPSCRLLLAL